MNGPKRVRDIVFRGLTAPLRLDGAEAILPVLREAASGWPFDLRPADPAAAPFYKVTARSGTDLLWCECPLDDRPDRWFDPVNAACDAISALALALPAERPELICLHAAGVAMAGRLVVFPNIRRAGKSTLSAALAKAGLAVFSDDVVPVSFPGGDAQGLAMGIAPRLRLPLPDALDAAFRDWADQSAGPSNRQYRYLRLAGQPIHGDSLPIGAFVILDRQASSGPARLEPMPPDAAMDALLHQNFTRDRHSADILRLMAAVLAARPVHRLTYSDLPGAVACLTAAFADWPDPMSAGGRAPALRQATEPPAPSKAADPALPVGQRPGSLGVTIGQTLYLADAEGRAIHRMDPLAAAIWGLIEEPMCAGDLAALLSDAFPNAGLARISDDVQRLLEQLRLFGLVEPRA